MSESESDTHVEDDNKSHVLLPQFLDLAQPIPSLVNPRPLGPADPLALCSLLLGGGIRGRTDAAHSAKRPLTSTGVCVH